MWACVNTQHICVTLLVCVQARGVWGHAPPEKFFLDLLRLLLTQSETKFPAIILMTHRC